MTRGLGIEPRSPKGTRRHSGMTRHGRVWRRDNYGYPVGTVPGTTIALLSRTEKMPGPSWAIPAGAACPFMVIGPGTICGTICYATRGRYTDAVHARALWARFEWARTSMQTDYGIDEFVAVMVRAIAATGSEWFRIHDAGDFFSEQYTRAWQRVAAALPSVHFWGPTRSWQAPWVAALVELNALPNVTIRPSAILIDAAPPVVAGLAAGTAVSATTWDCPAAENAGRCGDCRRCWTVPEQPTTYHMLKTRGNRRWDKRRPLDLLPMAGQP